MSSAVVANYEGEPDICKDIEGGNYNFIKLKGDISQCE